MLDRQASETIQAQLSKHLEALPQDTNVLQELLSGSLARA